MPVHIHHGRAESFVPPPPWLRLEPILRFHGYRDLDRVRAPIREAAEAMIPLAAKLVEPQVVFLTKDVDRVGPDTLALVDGPVFHGRCLGTHLASARSVAYFILTIGAHLEGCVAEMADRDELLEALFLDAAGWLAVEEALRAFRGHLRALVHGAGVRLSPRLGPGYLDWPLAEQALLFRLFDGETLPVALNEYCVMSPGKSISGSFGIVSSC